MAQRKHGGNIGSVRFGVGQFSPLKVARQLVLHASLVVALCRIIEIGFPLEQACFHPATSVGGQGGKGIAAAKGQRQEETAELDEAHALSPSAISLSPLDILELITASLPGGPRSMLRRGCQICRCVTSERCGTRFKAVPHVNPRHGTTRAGKWTATDILRAASARSLDMVAGKGARRNVNGMA